MTSSYIEKHEEQVAKGEMLQQVLPFAMVHGEAYATQPKDLFIPPDALEVVLEAFEGPLDLMLYLIRKQKFNIVDLPVAEISIQYIEYVEVMKDLKLELAAEYLVMAAILAEIKSRLLLPKTEIDDDEEDPRAELVRRLQEYEVIKLAAQNIDEIPRLERDNFEGTVALPANFQPRIIQADVHIQDMVMALQGVLKRAEAFGHHQIKRENLSTRERMTQILSILSASEFTEFTELFTVEEGRSGVVVSFLAILELIKESIIECIQAQEFGQIQLKLATNN